MTEQPVEKRRKLDSPPIPTNPKPKSKATDPLAIFARCKKENRVVKVAGPMVRYSKLPFRHLMGKYDADIIYSPMMLAREFVRHYGARDADFTTNREEHNNCLVVQVGCNNVCDLLRFVEMVKPYCDAVGLNCGCPVRDQVREGIGAALMYDVDKVVRMVKAVKEKFGDSIRFETKIRIHDDINKTIEFVQKVEDSGVDWITIHGRTKDTRSSVPVNIESIKKIREAIKRVPLVANGDCFLPEDVDKITKLTGVDGVMAVRGILKNPTLFSNYQATSWGAIEIFMNAAMEFGLQWKLIQFQLSSMLPGGTSDLSNIKLQVNECGSLIQIIDLLDEKFDLKRRGEDGFGENKTVEEARKTTDDNDNDK